jgi:hypothetical protein
LLYQSHKSNLISSVVPTPTDQLRVEPVSSIQKNIQDGLENISKLLNPPKAAEPQ